MAAARPSDVKQEQLTEESVKPAGICEIETCSKWFSPVDSTSAFCIFRKYQNFPHRRKCAKASTELTQVPLRPLFLGS